MTDADKRAPTDEGQPQNDLATTDSERTIQPSEADTHGSRTNDQTLQPSEPADKNAELAGLPVDRTIPPTSSGSSAAAETSAEPVHDQTLQPGKSAPAADELDSNAFGDYEILQEIARGGMGVVYKARQVSLNRIVALKKILSGQLAGEEDLKRFQIEAEASAQLDHVGIVPVYDFGQVDGQYYFSMGFVEGDDLAERIRERPMEAEAAAGMMIKIAQAVGYANDQGVIHRDLKPSNVLLDGQNEPKVTDFGVAKQQGNDSEMTAQGQILGTPSYMPPEQAAGQGDTVDQRSDVYALGAILYALLTGRPPFQAATAMETMIQVLDQQPVPISQLNSTIPRDLETICLKCLQKDPDRRYASAEALAEDLQRYLADEPIVARPPTRVEQLGRWVRKNRATAIASGVVAAALIVATIISISFAVEASRQRDVAAGQRDAAKIAKEEADNQREIAEAKTEEVAQKADEMQVMVDFQAEQLSGIDVPAMGASLKAKMIEELQLEPSAAASADFTGASLQLLDEHIFGPALVAIDQRFAEQPLVQARLLQTMATTLRELGLLERAMQPQQQAFEVRRRELGDDHSDSLVSINNLGQLLQNQGKDAEAEALFREALEGRRRTLGDEHPDTLTLISNLGQVIRYGDLLLAKNVARKAEREALIREALEGRRRTLGDDHPDTLTSINNMGSFLYRERKYDKALSYYNEALETKRGTLGDEHPDTLASIYNLGRTLQDQGKYAEAEPFCREALEARRRTLGDEHPDTLASIDNMGFLLQRQGKYDEALPYYSEVVETKRGTLGDEHPSTLVSINSLGEHYRSHGKWAEAEPFFREALEARRRTLGDEHPATLRSIGNHKSILMRIADPDKYPPITRKQKRDNYLKNMRRFQQKLPGDKETSDKEASDKEASDKEASDKEKPGPPSGAKR